MRNLLLIVVTIFVLGLIVAFPAFGNDPVHVVTTDRTDESVHLRFTENTTNGFVKGLELHGRKVSTEERSRAYQIAYDLAPAIFAEAKRAGVWEQYKLQMFDPEIRELDAKALEAKSIEEISGIVKKQMGIVQTRYPEVYQWLEKSPKVQSVARQIIVRMFNAIN